MSVKYRPLKTFMKVDPFPQIHSGITTLGLPGTSEEIQSDVYAHQIRSNHIGLVKGDELSHRLKSHVSSSEFINTH